MSGIAGIAERDKKKEVQQMLDKISHRGRAGSRIIETEGATLGVVWTEPQSDAEVLLKEKHIAKDEAGKGQFAQAEVTDDGVILTRDPIGVAPLYYGHTKNGDLSFASEELVVSKT
jgi:asparagine synthase (glutamine-hydrolysing)